MEELEYVMQADIVQGDLALDDIDGQDRPRAEFIRGYLKGTLM